MKTVDRLNRGCPGPGPHTDRDLVDGPRQPIQSGDLAPRAENGRVHVLTRVILRMDEDPRYLFRAAPRYRYVPVAVDSRRV